MHSEKYGKLNAVAGDRGFHSKANDQWLAKKDIYNAICPKAPKQLSDRLIEPEFKSLQTRRSQTEGRIGIFKNVFLGKPLKSKGYSNKATSICMSVLTHNLWVIARKAQEAKKKSSKKPLNQTQIKNKKITTRDSLACMSSYFNFSH